MPNIPQKSQKVNQHAAGRRLRGVFVLCVHLDIYQGPPVRKYDYFPSTRAASKFLGYKSDAVRAALSADPDASGYAFMQKRGISFAVPWALDEKHAPYWPEARQALLREFPEWFTDEVARVGRSARPVEDYCI